MSSNASSTPTPVTDEQLRRRAASGTTRRRKSTPATPETPASS
jgi:hypothetical protein